MPDRTDAPPVPAVSTTTEADFEQVFAHAPVSLWIEDYSGLHALFARWRSEGVTDLAAHLASDPARVREAAAGMRVLRVNHSTLALFGAETQAQLVGQLGTVFGDDSMASTQREWQALWDGTLAFRNQSINYTLHGKRLDVMVSGHVLAGHEACWDRVLVALEDITARTAAQRRLAVSERYARDLFEHSPVSLWVEDFSAVKQLLDGVRASGISDFATFMQVHPEFVTRCMEEIRVIDVNQQTLRMFGAADKGELLGALGRIFRGEMQRSFAEQLQDLWAGKTTQSREVVNYALGGEPVNVHMQFAVLDGHAEDWGLVIVSLTDITARKKAEAYLEFLGKHDALTKLRNRAYYAEELNRLARRGPWPVGVVAIDLNGLKPVNDEEGHAAGDALLRRAGEVLAKAVDAPSCAARIGGDEFAVLLPGADARATDAVRERIGSLLELNNSFYPGRVLSMAIGTAVCEEGAGLEAALQEADRAMYADKRLHQKERRTPAR